MSKTRNKESFLELGKIPPSAIDFEEAVLGAVMLEKNAIDAVCNILQPQSFYKEDHALIFKSVLFLYSKNQPIDILTVTNQLRNTGELDIVGGAYAIVQLTNKIASAANIEFHARIIVQKFLQREIIRISSESIRDAYEDTTDIFDLIDTMEHKIFTIQNSNQGTIDVSAVSRMDETKKFILYGMQNKGITGIPVGLQTIDTFTGGFQRGDLIVVGGLPGTFKTALTIFMAHSAEQMGFPAYVSEQEMSKVQTGMREIGMVSGINTEQMRRGEISEGEMMLIDDAVSKIKGRRVYIEHESGQNVEQICSKLKRVKAEYGIEMAVIDYLQIVEGSSETKNASVEERISKITRRLKITAKNLNIPIILLSQFNREASKNTRPSKHFLKGSGAIEADADVIILLWNPFTYDKEMEITLNDVRVSVENKLCFIFDKHRMGRLGDIWIGVRPWNNTFYDVENIPATTTPTKEYSSMKPNRDFEPNEDIKPF